MNWCKCALWLTHSLIVRRTSSAQKCFGVVLDRRWGVQHHLQRVESLLEEQCNISDLEQNNYLKTATGNASLKTVGNAVGIVLYTLYCHCIAF